MYKSVIFEIDSSVNIILLVYIYWKLIIFLDTDEIERFSNGVIIKDLEFYNIKNWICIGFIFNIPSFKRRHHIFNKSKDWNYNS